PARGRLGRRRRPLARGRVVMDAIDLRARLAAIYAFAAEQLAGLGPAEITISFHTAREEAAGALHEAGARWRTVVWEGGRRSEEVGLEAGAHKRAAYGDTPTVRRQRETDSPAAEVVA